ncbi:MAG: DJ-1/PfpI family protein [Thermoleophilia bacterium]
MPGTESAPVAHLAVYDDLADFEVGHLLAELRTGRFTGVPFAIVTAGATPDPIVTMGGIRIVPDVVIDDADPAASRLLVLPGSTLWDAGGGAPFVDAARRFAAAGVPVAAICGAVLGLARAGLLDGRDHTGAAPEYLAQSGYAGAGRYRDARAVADGGLITAGPQSPIHFARAVLGALGLASDRTLDAYEDVFHRGDPAGYPALMEAAGAA